MYNEFEEYDLKTKLNHKIWIKILKEMLRYPWYLIGAIVSMIGATIGTLTFDLTQASKQISIKLGGNYFAPTLLAGCFYLAIVYLITFAIARIERRFKASDRY